MAVWRMTVEKASQRSAGSQPEVSIGVGDAGSGGTWNGGDHRWVPTSHTLHSQLCGKSQPRGQTHLNLRLWLNRNNLWFLNHSHLFSLCCDFGLLGGLCLDSLWKQSQLSYHVMLSTEMQPTKTIRYFVGAKQITASSTRWQHITAYLNISVAVTGIRWCICNIFRRVFSIRQHRQTLRQ